jgi:tripartite-type tricarboxylate transporter receptor subunit TctC
VDTVAARQFISSGKLNGILVTSRETVPILPDVPNLTQVGHPEDEVSLWHTFLVKAGTPPDIVSTIESALKKMPEDKEFSEFLKSASIEWNFAPGAEFAPRVTAEMAQIKDSLTLLKPKK